jgi:hypothetical protein
MDAGSHQAQSGALSIIPVRRIDLSARFKQQLDNCNRILRRLLSKILDPISGHVMQERRLVVTCRMRSNQIRIFAQQTLEGGNVAVDNCISR